MADEDNVTVGGLRQRRTAGSVSGHEAVPERPRKASAEASTSSPPRRPATLPGVLAALLVIAAAYAGFALRRDALAPPDPAAPERAPEALFSVDNAYAHLSTIAATPRWTGTQALDRSLAYILREIETMKRVAADNDMVLEAEHYTADGSFIATIAKRSMVISYSKLPSVVARLSPAGYAPSASSERDSLLVNAHVDSAWGSPGASDNVVGVAATLESINALASTPPSLARLVRPVVFLFNGGEEPLLAGAHGFVKTHRWARTIAAHINLESMGSGDAYLLFNAGPANPWLAKAYARAVKRPWASVAGADIFESRAVPAETDFRIFKDAGIPGYDFALIENGYVYHTIYDDVKHVSKNSVRYGGQELILPLVMELAGTSDAIGTNLLNTGRNETTLEYRVKCYLGCVARRLPGNKAAAYGPRERSIWVDVVGRVAVVYPEVLHVVLCWSLFAVYAFIWCSPVSGKSAFRDSGLMHGAALRLKARMFLSVLLSILAGMSSATAAAVAYVRYLERPLSWFTSSRFALAVFVPPAVIGSTLALSLSRPMHQPQAGHMAMLHSCGLLYAAVVMAFAMRGLRMGVMPMFVVSGYVLAALISIKSWPGVFVRFCITLIPLSLFAAPQCLDILRVFLPIMGRSGNAPSDIIAAMLVSFLSLLYGVVPVFPVFVYFPASIARVRRHAIFLALFVACLVAMLPELTLPHRNAVYTKDGPKRVLVTHFQSAAKDHPSVIALGSMDVIPVDVNTTVRILPYSDIDCLDHMPTWSSLGSNPSEMLRPYSNFVANWSVIEVDKPLDLPIPTAQIVDEVVDGTDPELVKVSILVSAPESHQISLRMPLGGEAGAVESWSLSDKPLDMGDGQGAWVRHVGSGSGAEELRFSVIVRKNAQTGKRPPIIFDVTGARPGKTRSPYLPQLYFPQWVAPVYIQSTGASFSL